MEKIKMTTPLVEMDGDEMTRILWKMIKDELILPFVDLKTEYYDLGLPNRDATADQVTMDAALANKKYGVSVKCATITPNAQRVEEYKLHEMWKSPNGTIRAVLDGTVFRAPIMIDSIQPVVKNWKKPITIARHAYGDVYKCTEFRIPGAGKAELVFSGADGSQQRATVFDFEGAGVLQGQYNKDDSIRSFARSCFNYALDVKQSVRKAKEQLRQSHDTHAMAGETVDNSMQQAYTMHRQAFAELHTQQKSVELAQQNYNVVNNRYLNQLALITDMIDASNIKLNAELQEINARINIAYTYYNIRYVAGSI